jgi:hypothetical protein
MNGVLAKQTLEEAERQAQEALQETQKNQLSDYDQEKLMKIKQEVTVFLETHPLAKAYEYHLIGICFSELYIENLKHLNEFTTNEEAIASAKDFLSKAVDTQPEKKTILDPTKKDDLLSGINAFQNLQNQLGATFDEKPLDKKMAICLKSIQAQAKFRSRVGR